MEIIAFAPIAGHHIVTWLLIGLVAGVLAHMVVTPALFYLILGAPWNAPAPTLRRKMEGGMLTVGLTLAGFLAFNTGIAGVDFTEPQELDRQVSRLRGANLRTVA